VERTKCGELLRGHAAAEWIAHVYLMLFQCSLEERLLILVRGLALWRHGSSVKVGGNGENANRRERERMHARTLTEVRGR
jgi:hypothetical protein